MAQADRMLSMPPINTSATRRRFLTVAAGASVASVGALTAAAMAPPIPAAVTMPALRSASRALAGAHQHDPVFGLIEAHRKAEAAHLAALDEQERLEKAGIWHCEAAEQSCHDEFNTFDDLVSAPATTLPGIHAKLAYLQDVAKREPWMFGDRKGTAVRLMESFSASLANVLAVLS